MYICPVCGKEFISEPSASTHYLRCWKENNAIHKSKPAPREEDIEIRTANQDIINFFSSLR